MTVEQLRRYLEHPNVRAFLLVIRHGESGLTDDAYRMRFGGLGKPVAYFDDFTQHPRIFEPTYGGKQSSAAGAYQITATTWDGLVRQYGFADFTPTTQDLAAVALVCGRKAVDDLLAGRFDQAVAKCRLEWTSLPGAAENNAKWTLARAREFFVASGGTLDATPQPTEPTSMPILAALLPTIVNAIPSLISVFGKDGNSERNAKAAQIVADTVVQATNAVNLQEATEKLTSDPAALAAATQAVNAEPYLTTLMEVGYGGIAAARKAASDPDQIPFYRNPAFLISSMLFVLPLLLCVDVFFVHPDAYAGEIRTQIVTGILGVIMLLGGYWLGTSFGSSRKTELLAEQRNNV